MAGSRLSALGSRTALAAAGPGVLKDALLAAAREKAAYCFLLGNQIANTSLHGEDFDLLKKSVLAGPVPI